jgi:hypothetical protein
MSLTYEPSSEPLHMTLIKRYSEFINFPIFLQETKTEEIEVPICLSRALSHTQTHFLPVSLSLSLSLSISLSLSLSLARALSLSLSLSLSFFLSRFLSPSLSLPLSLSLSLSLSDVNEKLARVVDDKGCGGHSKGGYYLIRASVPGGSCGG